MNTSISKHLVKTREKSRQTRSSSVGDISVSPETAKLKKQGRKGQKQLRESNIVEDNSMSIQDKLEEINRKLELLEITRQDIKQIRTDMETLTAKVMDRVDRMEGTVFELQTSQDKINSEVRRLKEENTSLRSQLNQQKTEISNNRVAQNDIEQHGRLWNVRVFGVKEEQGKVESVADCVKKCTEIFTNQVGVPVTEEDIEIAHRTGRPGTGRPRPIIVRFFSRQKKGRVLENRKKLKQSGVSVGEDLTKANYNLMMRASKHSAALSAWSSNGKVLTKLKNGKILKVDTSANLDETFKKAME